MSEETIIERLERENKELREINEKLIKDNEVLEKRIDRDVELRDKLEVAEFKIKRLESKIRSFN
jgi:hypothetical protein